MKIIVPFDFSMESVNALKLAAEIALRHKLNLTVLHSLNIQKFSYMETSYTEDYEKFLVERAYKAVNEMVKETLKSTTNIEVKVQRGSPSSNILKESYNPDVIYTVMGQKDRHIPEKIGSTTQNILRYAVGSVLSIQNEIFLDSLNNIMLLTDFGNIPSKAMSNIKLLQRANDARLTFFYVNTKEDWLTTTQIEEKMRVFNELHEMDKTSLIVINDNSIESAVIGYLNLNKVDMIALKITRGTLKKNLKETHLSAEIIMENTNIPLMTFAHEQL